MSLSTWWYEVILFVGKLGAYKVLFENNKIDKLTIRNNKTKEEQIRFVQVGYNYLPDDF